MSLTSWILLIAAGAALALLGWRFSRLRRQLQRERRHWEQQAERRAWEEAQSRFHQWRQQELEAQRQAIRRLEEQRADNLLQAHKREFEERIRSDALARSGAVLRGQAAEHLAPFLPQFGFLPKDARFLGSPVDFVVFQGLSEERCDRVVLVEVKSGRSTLSTRERRVRDAVRAGRVEWKEVRLRSQAPRGQAPVIVEPSAD
ncbi:MAG TPA: Holliday junction resolvase-like protein [Acidobacteriota bacterium]|nr:Holliday junction resolvase-like protein [Acidobacteriota bacterium]